MALSHDHVEIKILAKIKIYILTRVKSLCSLCHEIPCTCPHRSSLSFYYKFADFHPFLCCCCLLYYRISKEEEKTPVLYTYNCSIDHILEYEFCHLGCWAALWAVSEKFLKQRNFCLSMLLFGVVFPTF